MKIKSVDLGLRIESIRRNLGLNKTEFGKLFKATGSLVNKWETGQVIPNEERIKDIADLGNISVNELLYGNIDSFIFETLTDEIERDSRLRELAIDFMNHAMTRVFITGEEKKYIPAKFNDVDKKNFFQTDDLVFMLSGEIGDIVDWIKEFYKEDPVPYDAEKIIRYGCMYFEQKLSLIHIL
ncbi:helix-turn-helix transcriptional regulator, partial [Aerococcus mictus]|uniref:helix-turn-helix domain-containing protein n=1 Tax=Aerococcus mictus TaxID=2976810 RepID=UPI0012440450